MTDFNQKTHDTDVGSHGGQSRQMMEVFENQEFGSIRVLQEAGKTFFCASDVAKALLKKPRPVKQSSRSVKPIRVWSRCRLAAIAVSRWSCHLTASRKSIRCC